MDLITLGNFPAARNLCKVIENNSVLKNKVGQFVTFALMVRVFRENTIKNNDFKIKDKYILSNLTSLLHTAHKAKLREIRKRK